MELYERVVLLEDIADTPFVKGDVGTIVDIYSNGKGLEIEIFSIDGTTLGVETVDASMVKSCNGIKAAVHINDIAA